MITVELEITYLPQYCVMTSVEKLEPEELADLKHLISEAVSGKLSFMKFVGKDGNIFYLGHNILINSKIELIIK